MPVILFVLGILLTGVGIVLVGFAIPINESAIGQTLLIAGAIAVVGGPLLVGMGAAISQLSQIAAGLKAKPASRTGRVAAAVQRAEEIFPDPHPHAVETRAPEARVAGPGRVSELRLPEPAMPEPPAIEATPAVAHETAGATAIERLRATMSRPSHQVPPAADVEDVPLSPNGSQHPTAPVLDSMPPMEPPQRAPEPVGRAIPTDGAIKEPRLDFLFRSRPTRPASSDTFDAMWPKRNGRVAAEPPRVEKVESTEKEDFAGVAAITIEPPAPIEERRPPPMVEERRPIQRVSALPERAPVQAEEARPSVAILKSGVVDGMAYTLYADGSIEAQLPQGTVRFGSIAELRAHIENNS